MLKNRPVCEDNFPPPLLSWTAGPHHIGSCTAGSGMGMPPPSYWLSSYHPQIVCAREVNAAFSFYGQSVICPLPVKNVSSSSLELLLIQAKPYRSILPPRADPVFSPHIQLQQATPQLHAMSRQSSRLSQKTSASRGIYTDYVVNLVDNE